MRVMTFDRRTELFDNSSAQPERLRLRANKIRPTRGL